MRLLAVTLALCCAPAFAGPFLRPAGSGTVAVTSSTLRSTASYDDDGGVLGDAGPLTIGTVAVEGEVGLSPRLLLLGRLPFVLGSSASSGVEPGVVYEVSSVAGFGDAVAGAQLGLLVDEPFVVSLRGEVKLPLYEARPSVRGRAPRGNTREASSSPARGDGQVDATASVVIGARFPFDGFFAWDTGYRLRTGDVSDAVVGGGEFAVAALDGRILPSWKLRFVSSLDPRVVDGAAVEAVGAGGVTTGPALRVFLPELARGLALDVGAGLLFRGRNSPGGPVLSFGASCDF